MGGLSEFVFQGSVFLVLPPMIWHSWKTRGSVVTILFFVFTVAFAHAKEATTSVHERLYIVGAMAKGPDEVPIVIVAGWVFAFYVSWCLGKNLVARFSPERSQSVFPVLAATMLVVAAVSFCMEAVGIKMGWWAWDASTGVRHVPVLPMVLWAQVTFRILAPFFIFIVPNTLGERIDPMLRVMAMLLWLSFVDGAIITPFVNAQGIIVMPLLILTMWFLRKPVFLPRDGQPASLSGTPAE